MNYLHVCSENKGTDQLIPFSKKEFFPSVQLHVSQIIRKWLYVYANNKGKNEPPAFSICENKDADQLHGNREADQRLCFRYMDSIIPLLPKSKISSL